MVAKYYEFPLNTGSQEGSDETYAERGAVHSVANMRLDREGRLVRTKGFRSLAGATDNGQVDACTLATLNGNLVSIGTALVSELIPSTGPDPDTWRPVAMGTSFGASGTTNELTKQLLPTAPSMTELQVHTPPVEETIAVHSAVIGDFLGLLYQQLTTARLVVVHRVTGQTRYEFRAQDVAMSQLVASNGAFCFVHRRADGSVAVRYYRPNVDHELSAADVPIPVAGLAVTGNNLAACSTGGVGLSIAYSDGTGVIWSRIDLASPGIAATNAAVLTGSVVRSLAIASDSSGGNFAARVWIARENNVTRVVTSAVFQAGNGAALTGTTNMFAAASLSTSLTRLTVAIRSETGQACIAHGLISGAPATGNDLVINTFSSFPSLASPVAETVQDLYQQSTAVPVMVGGLNRFAISVIPAQSRLEGDGVSQLLSFGNPTDAPAMVIAQRDYQSTTTVSAQAGGNRGTSTLSLATSPAAVVWPTLAQSAATQGTQAGLEAQVSALVSLVSLDATEKRSVTEYAGSLYVSGAVPIVYDGRFWYEHGFAERPVLIQITLLTGGSITSGATYRLRAVYECIDAQGNVTRSQASDPVTVVTGASDTAMSGSVTTPHSMRYLAGNTGISSAIAVRIGIYRTVANGATFYLDTLVSAAAGSAPGDRQALPQLTRSDASLRTSPVLYEQSQTPIPHMAPQGYRYGALLRERMLVAGLVDEYSVCAGKIAAPRETLNFANPYLAAFQARAAQAVTAIADAGDGTGLVFTRDRIYALTGRGPESDGTGEFDALVAVSVAGGTANWRSVVTTPIGVMYQATDGRLMLLAGGQSTWIGANIRDTLSNFPVIVAAVLMRGLMTVAFACNGANGQSGVLLYYDLRANAWTSEAAPGSPSAMRDMVSYRDGLAIADNTGVVHLSRTEANPPLTGDAWQPRIETKWLGLGFDGNQGGWGSVYAITALASCEGPARFNAWIDYDDGLGFVQIGAQDCAPGRVELQFSVERQKAPRIRVAIQVTDSPSQQFSPGLRLLRWGALVDMHGGTAHSGSAGRPA